MRPSNAGFRRKLIIFVKAPRLGSVKRRLAEKLGAAGACAAYRSIVERLLRELSKLKEVQLRFTPDDAAGEVKQWQAAGWELRPQAGGDLGRRLAAAFNEAFRQGAGWVVIIGSDCPSVTVQDIRKAWKELKGNDVVLGPARDGGYWLIGLREERPELFEGIRWSTEAVLKETLERARRGRLTVKLLRELRDVDTAEDWDEWRRRGTE